MTLSVLFFIVFIVAGVFVARRFHVFRKAKPCTIDGLPAVQSEFIAIANKKLCCQSGPTVGEYLVSLFEKFPGVSLNDLRVMYYADRDIVRAADGVRLSANDYQEEFAAIHAQALDEHEKFIKFLIRALFNKLTWGDSVYACAAAYSLRQEYETVLELLELCEESNAGKD